MAEELLINIIGDASKLKGELDKASKNVTSFSDKIGKIGKVVAVAGAAVTAAFTAIVLKTAAVGDQFDKMSLRTGIAVEDLSALAYAADISGTDIGTLEKGLKALTKVMDDANRGIGEGLEAFEELGISVVDTEGKLRSTVDVLKEAATKISAIEDPTKQAAYAMDLFGARAGPALLPLLKQGEGGIEALMSKAKELGIVVSTEAATAAAEFTDRLTDLKGSLFGAGRMIGDTLIPAITPLIEKVIEIVKKIKDWTEAHKPLVETIIKIVAKLGVLAAVGGPILMAVAAFSKMHTAITLLGTASSGPIFLLIGAIVAVGIGCNKLTGYLKETVGGLRDFREEIGKMNVAQIDAEIKSLEITVEGLLEKLNKIPEKGGLFGIFKREDTEAGQIILTMLNELYERIDMLKKQREELTKVEEKGIEVADLLNEKTEEAISLNEKLADALKTITDRLFELTHTEMENNIRKLGEQKQAYIDLGISQEVVNRWYALEIKKLTELHAKMEKATATIGIGAKAVANISSELKKLAEVTGKVGAGISATAEMVIDDMTAFSTTTMIIFEKLKNDFKSTFIDPVVGYLEQNLTYAISGLLGGIEDFEWSWEKFWTGLKNTLINAVAAMIAKLVILAGFSWLLKLLGVPVSWLSWDKGGGVEYQFGGEVKRYAPGGGVDTVPARLTVGEYVISKPMTDFIKRFKAIPQNLVDAVVRGLPTPVPAFAGGGAVGPSNISRSDFGEIKIYVDIHDNRISDDVDIKRLAATVSDEILRKINLKRRH